MSEGIVFHTLATFAYAALAALMWHPLRHGRIPTRTSTTVRSCLLLTLLLHGMALYQSVLPPSGLYLGWALAFSAAIWLGMLIFWLESLVLNINGLLLILLPASALVSGIAALFPSGHLVANAANELLRLHLLIALMAYGLITVAALQAVLMATLDRYLHRPSEQVGHTRWFSNALDVMPPLLVQEKLLFRLVWISFLALTFTLVTGSMVSVNLAGTLFPVDHKTVFTVLSWLTFALLLAGRYLRGWRGRLALRWTLAGFAFVVLAYTGSRFVLDVLLGRS